MHRRREALAAPLDSCFRVTVSARKGGVGKTTSSIGIGMALANARRDHVITLDGNPDAGSAGDRVPKQTEHTVRDFRADLEKLRTYQEMRRYTNQDPVTGLEVLASSQDPAESKAFGRDDYIETVNRLSDEYQILITDSGTDITADVQSGVRELSHSYVLACGTRVDEAAKAAATFDWMQNHGHHDKVAASIVLIVSNSPVNKTVRLDEIRRHFEQRCRAVVYIPFDDHLNEGGIIVWNELRRQTREAFEYAAEYVAEGFNRIPDLNRWHPGQG